MRKLAQNSVKGIMTAAVVGALLTAGGCASSGETAQRDALMENVGKYPAAPSGVNKPRVGVPPFAVQVTSGFQSGPQNNEAATDSLAADQMSSLLDASERFSVIERTQLQKLLSEQNMEGIVTPGEMAKTGQVRGVDFLLVGKVTNLRTKTESNERGFGLAQITGFFNAGGADVKKKSIKVTTECGVDMRLVNPTTGEVVWSQQSDFQKTDSADAMGLDILGASANADANIQIGEDDKGKILRLALDDAFKKGVPKLDKFLKSEKNVSTSTAAPAAAAETPAVPVTPTATPAAPARVAPTAVASKKFCPNCGKEVPAGTKFCPADGTAVQ